MTHPIVAALAGGAAATRRAACDAAPDDPSAVLLVDSLAAALGDEAPAVVHAAVRALERIGRGHDAVLPALARALERDDPRVRLEAAWTWARLEPPPVKLLPVVVAALPHATGNMRWRAARLLVELARLHGEVGALVEDLAGDAHPARVRRIALAALRELAPAAPRTLAVHLEASRASDIGLRRLALTGLAGLGAVTPALWERVAEAIAADPDSACRRVAATGSATLGDPPAAVRDALARGADADRDAGVRAAARRALEQIARRSAQKSA